MARTRAKRIIIQKEIEMATSIHWALSARTGDLLAFKSQFELDVWQLAELDPNVKGYQLRTPTFTYFDGKRERKGDFMLFIEKTSGERELWNPTDDRASQDRPVERARVAFSKRFEMKYVMKFRADVYADQIAVMNGRTIMGVLSTNRGKVDTEGLEAAVMTSVPAGTSLSVSTLADGLESEMALVRLAIFRLCAKGWLVGESKRYIGPNWKIRRFA